VLRPLACMPGRSSEAGSVLQRLVPSDLSGMGVRALISEIHRRNLPLAIVIIGRKSDLAIAVELVRAGATDYLEQPFAHHELRLVVRRGIGTNGVQN
jgi:FixJ family two-component response regulator